MSIFYDKAKTKPVNLDAFNVDPQGFIILNEWKHYYCFDNVKIKTESNPFLHMGQYTIRAHIYDNVVCIGTNRDIIQAFNDSIVIAQDNAFVASHDNSTIIALDQSIVFNFEAKVLSYGDSRVIEYPAPERIQQ